MFDNKKLFLSWVLGLTLTVGVSVLFMQGWSLNASSSSQPSDINTTDFVTTWRTTVADETITLPIRDGSNYSLDCDGDGNYEQTNLTSAAVCQFSLPGDHQIRISWTISKFSTSQHPDRNKLISMDQWGTVKFAAYDDMFAQANKMNYKAVDKPDLSKVDTIRAMFFQVGWTFNDTINTWDVSNISNFASVFDSSTFNQPLNNWDTSNAVNMAFMFRWNRVFNQPLNNWNTSKVTNMTDMFGGARRFDGDITTWDVGKVTDMRGMFWDTPFNQDIGNWNVENVRGFWGFLKNAWNFNQDLSRWNPRSATNMWDFIGVFDDPKNLRSALSVENYDKILQSWNGKLPAGVNLGIAAYYCEAGDARGTITTNLVDKGRGCIPSQPLLNGSIETKVFVPENTLKIGVLEPQVEEGEDKSEFRFELLDSSVDLDKVEIVTDAQGRPVLYFKSPLPDYENPSDANKDRIYKVDVKLVNTRTNFTKTINYSIEITDEDERFNLSQIAPIISRKGVPIDIDNVEAHYIGNPTNAFNGTLTHNANDINLDPQNPNAWKYDLVYSARDNQGNQGTTLRKVEITDADLLKEQLDKANDPKTIENKTKDSIDAMLKVKDEAQKIFDNNRATQAEIDKATSDLKRAIDALKDKTSTNSNNSGGGSIWGGSGISMDSCPNGDKSPSYYDGTCEAKTTSAWFGNRDHLTGNAESFSAYDWAYGHGITTMSGVEKVRLNDFLTRAELSKMLTVFTQKFTKKTPLVWKSWCANYSDLYTANSDLQTYMKTSCELEVMGLHSDGKTPLSAFDPHKFVSRAELITTLSRVLYGNAYDNNQQYTWFENHMQKFLEEKIITKLLPHKLATRNEAFLMMYRVMGHIKN